MAEYESILYFIGSCTVRALRITRSAVIGACVSGATRIRPIRIFPRKPVFPLFTRTLGRRAVRLHAMVKVPSSPIARSPIEEKRTGRLKRPNSNIVMCAQRMAALFRIGSIRRPTTGRSSIGAVRGGCAFGKVFDRIRRIAVSQAYGVLGFSYVLDSAPKG